MQQSPHDSPEYRGELQLCNRASSNFVTMIMRHVVQNIKAFSS